MMSFHVAQTLILCTGRAGFCAVLVLLEWCFVMSFLVPWEGCVLT